MVRQTILVPRSIGAWGRGEQGVETLLENIQYVKRETVILDMQQVKFLRPYAVLMLACISRYLFQLTGKLTEFTEIPEKIHAYLERAKFFEAGDEWLYTNQVLPIHARLEESPYSDRILSMRFIRTEHDVYEIDEAVRMIFEAWLDFPEATLNNLIRVVVELCNNVRDHSNDQDGMILVQSYRTQNHFEVVLSVVDMGITIPTKLKFYYREMASTATEFIRLALRGFSSRGEGKGGNGLPTVCEIAEEYGGSVLLRSQNGRVKFENGTFSDSPSLCFFPGTQLQVELQSKIGDL